MTSPDDAVRVRIRPPMTHLGALAAGLALAWLAPWPLPEPGGPVPRIALGAALVAGGGWLLAACMRRFARAGTPVRCGETVRALVTDGPYARSRNPIYLALATLHAGLAVLAGDVWPLATLPPAMIAIRYAVIAREEAFLAARFGESWDAYRRRVRRWL